MCPIGEQLDRLCRQDWRVSIYYDRQTETWFCRGQQGDGAPVLKYSKESHTEAINRLLLFLAENRNGPAAAGGLGV